MQGSKPVLGNRSRESRLNQTKGDVAITLFIATNPAAAMNTNHQRKGRIGIWTEHIVAKLHSGYIVVRLVYQSAHSLDCSGSFKLEGMRTIDETDLHILRLLQLDGRMTNAALAEAIELTPPSTLYRVRALEKAGLIKGYHAVVDHERLGLRLMVICQVQLSLHQEQPIERFRKSVEVIPEVIECLHVSGQFDFHLKIVAKDMKHYESIVREKITKIKGIAHINSCFVLSITKSSHQVPL